MFSSWFGSKAKKGGSNLKDTNDKNLIINERIIRANSSKTPFPKKNTCSPELSDILKQCSLLISMEFDCMDQLLDLIAEYTNPKAVSFGDTIKVRGISGNAKLFNLTPFKIIADINDESFYDGNPVHFGDNFYLKNCENDTFLIRKGMRSDDRNSVHKTVRFNISTVKKEECDQTVQFDNSNSDIMGTIVRFDGEHIGMTWGGNRKTQRKKDHMFGNNQFRTWMTLRNTEDAHCVVSWWNINEKLTIEPVFTENTNKKRQKTMGRQVKKGTCEDGLVSNPSKTPFSTTIKIFDPSIIDILGECELVKLMNLDALQNLMNLIADYTDHKPVLYGDIIRVRGVTGNAELFNLQQFQIIRDLTDEIIHTATPVHYGQDFYLKNTITNKYLIRGGLISDDRNSVHKTARFNITQMSKENCDQTIQFDLASTDVMGKIVRWNGEKIGMTFGGDRKINDENDHLCGSNEFRTFMTLRGTEAAQCVVSWWAAHEQLTIEKMG